MEPLNLSVEPLSKGFEPLCRLFFGTFIWNPCGSWNLLYKIFKWNLGNLNLETERLWNLKPWTFLSVEPLCGIVGNLVPAAAPNHPEALLARPQALQATEEKTTNQQKRDWTVTGSHYLQHTKTLVCYKWLQDYTWWSKKVVVCLSQTHFKSTSEVHFNRGAGGRRWGCRPGRPRRLHGSRKRDGPCADRSSSEANAFSRVLQCPSNINHPATKWFPDLFIFTPFSLRCLMAYGLTDKTCSKNVGILWGTQDRFCGNLRLYLQVLTFNAQFKTPKAQKHYRLQQTVHISVSYLRSVQEKGAILKTDQMISP